jgi:hypothetical protein
MSNSKGDGLVLVCIDLSEPAETARRYFAEQKLPFTNLLDPNKETFNKYGAGGIPKIVLIDRDGSVRYFQQGRRSGQDFHAGVAKLGLGFRIRRRLTGSLTCRHGSGCRRVSRADSGRGTGTLVVSERREPDGPSKDVEDGVARDLATGKGTVFPDLRSAVDVRDSPQRGWRGG